jgi:hypothetical protein
VTWFRIDDSFADHPKVHAIPRVARLQVIGLWTSCGTWAARYLTDGFIPESLPEEIGARRSDTDALVNCRVQGAGVGLWERCEGGWLFHDWADYQPTRKATLDRRAANAERLRRWRDKGP